MSKPKDIKLTGAEAVAKTLIAGGVDVCFAKPGPSESDLMMAFCRVDGLRCIPGLFEGVLRGFHGRTFGFRSDGRRR